MLWLFKTVDAVKFFRSIHRKFEIEILNSTSKIVHENNNNWSIKNIVIRKSHNNKGQLFRYQNINIEPVKQVY